jgi:hypothetical protein
MRNRQILEKSDNTIPETCETIQSSKIWKTRYKNPAKTSDSSIIGQSAMRKKRKP